MYKLKKLFPQSLKNLYHFLQAFLANFYYGFPSKKIKVIGVTGTDGKTTTVQMIAKILEEAEKKVAIASTINFKINGSEEKNLSHYTTESAFKLQKFIKKAVENECEYLVLETSSHSLDQYRVFGVKYKTAVITNVTREHLDYHKSIEKYRNAKAKLFKKAKVAIVNLDMENPEEFMEYAKEGSFAYSISNFQFPISNKFSMSQFQIIKAENIELGISGSKYKIQDTNFLLNLPGLFNVENALAATCVGFAEGINLEIIKNALGKINNIPGRMESVLNKRGLNIIVDFALTPNALEKLYQMLFKIKNPAAKIIAIFGSCGDRDCGKRPIMGEIVSRYADIIILTNDEPYSENPKKIIDEIAAGIKNKIKNESLFMIMDRRVAIKKALEITRSGDIVVLTGMGNFESMVVGNKKIPWNDKMVVEQELKKLDKKNSVEIFKI